MNFSFIRYAWSELRGDKLKWSFALFTVFIAMLATTGVRSLRTGFETSINQKAQVLMGADLRVRTKNNPNTEQQKLMDEIGAQAEGRGGVIRLDSMLSVQKDQPLTTRLVKVQALSGDYPYYGSWQVEPKEALQQIQAKTKPAGIYEPIIIEDNLAKLLDIGQGSIVQVGGLNWQVIGIYTIGSDSPDLGFSLGERIFVRLDSLQKTDLIQLGSRVRYNYYYKFATKAEAETIKDEFWEESVAANMTLYTYKESSSGVQRSFGYITKFMQLAGLITLLLSGLGIAAVMRVLVRRKTNTIAVLKTIGVSNKQVVIAYSWIAVLITVAGTALALISLPILLSQVTTLLAGKLPINIQVGFDWLPLLPAIIAAQSVLFLFLIWPLYQVSRVEPWQVLQKRETTGLGAKFAQVAVLSVALLGLILYFSNELVSSPLLTVSFFGSVLVGFLLLGGIARLVLKYGRYLSSALPFALRQGWSNLYRPGNQTTGTTAILGLAVLLLAVLFAVNDSLSAMFIGSRQSGPGIFLVDVQPQVKPAIEDYLKDKVVKPVQFHPKISARITAINGQSVTPSDLEKNAVKRNWESQIRTREYLISYRDYLLESEELVAGDFMEKGKPNQASVDERWASQIGLKVGDTLELRVAGLPATVTITSLRAIDWTSIEPHSLILLSPDVLQGAPAVYYSSIKVKDKDTASGIIRYMATNHAGVTAINTTEAAAKIAEISGQILTAIEAITWVVLWTALLVIASSIIAARSMRFREASLWKVLGASGSRIGRIFAGEFASLAFLGLLVGGFTGLLGGYILIDFFFSIDYRLPVAAMALLSAGLFASIIGIGLLSSRKIAKTSGLELLRETN